ncbi:MAG: hypothetical protein QOC76_5023 [Mycobacterium sp.]|jgi:hypothetical protein|nr:hypothetical protein [Mycobacterium sp.]
MTLADIYEGWHEPNPDTVTITPTGLTVLARLPDDDSDTVTLSLEIVDNRLGTFVVTLSRTNLHLLHTTLEHVLKATDAEVEALKGTLKHGRDDD